jgi:hypothetical protein
MPSRRNGVLNVIITCGINWAEANHDVALVDDAGIVVARRRIDTGAAGFTSLLNLITKYAGTPEDTAIAIETDKNLPVVALAAAGVRGVSDQPSCGSPLP